MAPLKFTFLTDVHYYSPNLGVEGKAYELENSKNQKLLKNFLEKNISLNFRI